MKLLIAGINYAPDLVGVAKYTTEMAEWLASQGHAVRVITAPPYYPAWSVAPGYSAALYRREVMNTIPLIRCPLYVPQTPGGIRRLLHLASFATSSLPVIIAQALTFRPDVIFSIAPTIFSAPTVAMAARLTGARSWLHIQDFELDVAFALGLLKGSRTQHLARYAESALLRSFDRVSTISPQMVKLLESKGCDRSRTYELRNWVDVTTIQPTSGPNIFREALKLGADDTLLLYSGNIGQKQGLDIIVEAARALANQKNLHFLICGEGSGKQEIESRASGLDNVHFLPLQPASRLNALLNAADIHLLPQLANAADLVLPSKLTGMLASGRPVIATALAGTGLAHEIANCGLRVDVGALDDFVTAICRLAKDKALALDMGMRARTCAEQTWSMKGVLEAFERQLACDIGQRAA